MTNNNSNFSSKRRYYTEYYQLNSIPETMSLIEAECLETPADTTDHPQSSVKGIMCALGIITTLIVGSTWQLYRSVKATPVNPQITQGKKLSRTVLSENKQNQLAISKATKEIEILTHKNAIANGRF